MIPVRLISQALAALDRILDRIPKDEMIARFHSPEGLKIRAEIEDAEVLILIRDQVTA